MGDGDATAGNDARVARVDLAREPDFRLGAVQVRPSMREIEIGDEREALEPRVMQVLVALARAQGAVVSRDDLIESCWDGRIVGDDSIQRCLVRLRKVAEASDGAFAIETVTRIGYRLVAVGEAPPATPARRAMDRRLLWAVPAVVLVVLAAAVWWLLPRGGVDLPVAVLPFTTAAPDAVSHQLAAGLPDAVVADLATNQTPTLSRAASQGPGHGGARLLTSGAVEREGETLRVRFKVDDAKSGLTVWSAAMEGSAADSDGLREQVAVRIAEVLKRTVEGFEAEHLRPGGAELAAYFHINDVISNGNAYGVELLQVERDLVRRAPRFSRAHSNLASDLANSAPNQPGPVAARMRAEAQSEARLAQKLDPHNWEAWFALFQLAPTYDWVASEKLILQAMAAEPQNGIPMSYEAGLQRGTGRIQGSVAMQLQASRLAPTTPPLAQVAVDALAGAGRIDEARAASDRALRLWPDRALVRRAALDLELLYGSPDEAGAALDRYQQGAPRLEPGAASAWRSFIADRRAGRLRPETARALAAENPPLWGRSVIVPGALASLGDVNGALAFTTQMIEENPSRFRVGVLFGPASRPMLRDPRFIGLAAKMGLVTYWKTTGRWPDFCAWPDLPYDCKAEAARYR